MVDYLGIREKGDKEYKACCLGEALMVLHRMKVLDKSPFENNKIVSREKRFDIDCLSVQELQEYELLGLRGASGDLNEAVYLHDFVKLYPSQANKKLGSLAEMNDSGISWIQIAEYIENNPDNVFIESK